MHEFVTKGFYTFFYQALYEEIIKSETKYHESAAEREILSYRLQLAEEEIKLYLSNDPQDKKKARRYEKN